MITKLLGCFVVLLAVIYSRIATEHFGNNMLPDTDAEVITDGITCAIFALGVLILATSAKRKD